MPSLEEIRDALKRRRPRRLDVDAARRAAVAMVLRETADGPSVLFIERARHDADPWSGHMAFPGGRVEPDETVRGAAERETLEEVGLDLGDAELLGQLDDKQGNPVTTPPLVISAFVYAIDAKPALVTNYEVERALWFPVRGLRERVNHVHRVVRQLEFPGVLVGEPDRHVVWGLTYSFLESFFLAVGRPLPDRWTPGMRRYARGVNEKDGSDRDAAERRTRSRERDPA